MLLYGDFHAYSPSGISILVLPGLYLQSSGNNPPLWRRCVVTRTTTQVPVTIRIAILMNTKVMGAIVECRATESIDLEAKYVE